MRTRYFYLEDRVNKVDLMDVSRLATFAISLEPLPDANRGMGYISALHAYMDKNRDHLLFDSYNLLSSDVKGKELLYSNIALCLLEKSFREDGASKDTIKSYVTVVNQYHKLLNDNMMMYEADKSRYR